MKPTIPIKPVSEEQSLYESSKKIYARAQPGWFNSWRWVLVWFTQLLFYGLAWLPWNGRQAVLFELSTRKFYIFGMVFWPQDFIYLAILLIISALSLFLFTTVAGRLFCGYACPQTVYTEIFMWIERKIEGDRVARMRLDAAPMSAHKFSRKFAKHMVWIVFALWTGFTFVGYFTPIRQLAHEVIQLSLGPWQTFWVLFYGFATYGNAGWMREQVCKYMCPYARFQSVMFDKDTLIVTYDAQRGEPRGARKRAADPKALNLGSCIDCSVCVQVCPTGIDIRKGLQYECIGCGACIDACNQIMDKMSYPRGLIRYTTEHGLASGWDKSALIRHIFRPRVLIYTAILWIIILATGYSLLTRSPLKVDVLRDRGLPRVTDTGAIDNVYRLQVMNTDDQTHQYVIEADGMDGLHLITDAEFTMEGVSAKTILARLEAPVTQPGSHKIYFVIRDKENDRIQLKEKAVFLVPR